MLVKVLRPINGPADLIYPEAKDPEVEFRM